MSIGGELEILKCGSLIPTRVTYYLQSFILAYIFQNAYYTELSKNPAKLMPVNTLYDWELGVGRGVYMHNIWIFHVLS